LKIVAVAVALYFAFQIHIGLGIGTIVALSAFLYVRERPTLYAQKSNMAHSNGNLQQAVLWMEKTCASRNSAPGHQISLGFLLLKYRNTDRAEEVLGSVFQKALSREERMQIRIQLSLVEWVKGKHQDAIESMKELLSDFKNTIVYGNLGYMLILDGQLEEALGLNMEAYEYNGDDVTILDNLAQTYYFWHGMKKQGTCMKRS
jgi:tetratricopeptide (TPR) repeat protein